MKRWFYLNNKYFFLCVLFIRQRKGNEMKYDRMYICAYFFSTLFCSRFHHFSIANPLNWCCFCYLFFFLLLLLHRVHLFFFPREHTQIYHPDNRLFAYAHKMCDRIAINGFIDSNNAVAQRKTPNQWQYKQMKCWLYECVWMQLTQFQWYKYQVRLFAKTGRMADDDGNDEWNEMWRWCIIIRWGVCGFACHFKLLFKLVRQLDGMLSLGLSFPHTQTFINSQST